MLSKPNEHGNSDKEKRRFSALKWKAGKKKAKKGKLWKSTSWQMGFISFCKKVKSLLFLSCQMQNKELFVNKQEKGSKMFFWANWFRNESWSEKKNEQLLCFVAFPEVFCEENFEKPAFCLFFWLRSDFSLVKPSLFVRKHRTSLL